MATEPINDWVENKINLVKHYTKKFLFPYRKFTSDYRATPDLIVPGAMKAGTRSVWYYLRKHPLITSDYKEVHFFDRNYQRGLSWYRAHFPLKIRLNTTGDSHPKKITGEATPYYLNHPLVPERLHENFPGVKLIFLLRDPVERAFSHYQHEVRKGREELSFEEAIEAEEERLSGEEEKLRQDPSYRSYNHLHYSYLLRGRYVEYLKKFYELFPETNIMIIDSESFFRNPQNVYQSILKFLDLPEFRPDSFPTYNEGEYQDSMSEDIRRELYEYYQPYNEQLRSLTEKTLTWKIDSQ